MRTGPITPALIDFSGEVPMSPQYGDLYHPRSGALHQAQQVFLQGNGLPQRWRGRTRFTLLETGFGLGNNFLATWQAWRDDAERCERLFYVSIERHPPSRDALVRAHQHSPLPALATALHGAWPPLTAGLHALDFDRGRVQLLLALGDVTDLLPTLRLQADAFYLDGFAPAHNPQMWQPRVLKALGRKAAPGATLATWNTARDLRAGLEAAGFELQSAPGASANASANGRHGTTLARFAPRFALNGSGDSGAVPEAQEVAIVGAGIAGAATAAAFVRLGLHATVFERHAEPAAEASGNAAGLFHGIVHPDDGPYARLFRAAALQAQRSYTPRSGRTPGLLRLDRDLDTMQALLQAQALPADYVQALDAIRASQHAGVALQAPAWFYPGGGWLAPGDWVRQQLARPGVSLQLGHEVARVVRDGDRWRLCDPHGRTLMRTPLLVLANAAQAQHLLAPLGYAPWPLAHSRGQVTHWAGSHPLQMAVAGDGYALPLPGGLLCGATREEADPGTAAASAPRAADHHHNIERLQRLTGLSAPADPAAWHGRMGWRLHAADRLPIAGLMPQAGLAPGPRQDQGRWLPRERGLLVLTALGARGLTLAPLSGRLLAAQALGTPWPLEQDLADAIDPARWRVRAARRAGAGDHPRAERSTPPRADPVDQG